MKLSSIVFIFLVAFAQLAAGQLEALPGNTCPTQCNIASLIPQDGSSVVLGPAYSTVYVSASTVLAVTMNTITTTQPRPNWTVGTVLVLYQATGATVDISDPLSRNYGSIVNVGNAGNWEIVKIASVVDQSNFILQCNLANTYDALLTTIVEPIIADQIVLMDGVQVAPAGLEGNGSIANAVVPLIGNVITMSPGSKITATGKGFLGGLRGGVNTSIICMDCATTCKQFDYSYTERTWGARRGGSIAGDIDITFGRGAIANGGGGGNNHNAAGGGGANGWSNTNGVWTGDGVMDPAWKSAWLLETSVLSTSLGGGRGGYSFSALAQDPLVVPPGDCKWQGNSRLNNGGLGGRPIKYFQNFETYTKLFLGGGGGAGHENDWVGGSGGNGGGFAIVVANQIVATGSAAIEANGNPGQSSIPILKGPFDGSGGGGAGGSVFVVAYQSISSSITISAAGGRGGDNNALSTEEAEGGAGGGGGGVVSIAVPDTTTSPCATISVAGGTSGLQNGQTFFDSFRPNGGTDGNSGQCLVLTTAPPCATTPTASISLSMIPSSSSSTLVGSGTRSGSSSGSSGSGSGSGSGGGNGSGINNGGKGKGGKKNASPTPNHKKSHASNKNHNNNNDESGVVSITPNSLVIAVTSILSVFFFATNQLH